MSLKLSLKSGFTLIEMIVSLAIFSIIITMTIGALLVLISSNQKLQGEQSVMTNITFALDSMTREIRTGYNYYCESHSNTNGPGEIFSDAGTAHESLAATTQDCPNSRPVGHKYAGVSFYEGGDSITSGANRRILYFFDEDAKTIKRRVGNDAPQAIISSGLEIINAEFFVTGSAPLSVAGDEEQPTVTIYLEAKEIGEDKVYHLQTTVTQRILDL